MNFNPEKINIPEKRGILENEKHLNILYERIEKKLASYKPDLEDFRDIYFDEVDKDMVYVEEKLKQFDESLNNREDGDFFKKEKKIALITEGILTDQLSGEWFNSLKEDAPYTVVAHPTSDFDDIRNGADLVLEVFNKDKEQSKHLGLSIDVTFSSDIENLNRKMERIIGDITGKHGKPAQVKYFESDFDDYKGAVTIARSVIVLSRNTIEDLFKKEYSRDKDGLSSHQVQLSLLTQLQEQAETFLQLCKVHGNSELGSIYEDIYKNIKYLKDEKKISHFELEQDPILLQEKYDGLKLLHRALLNNIM